jgi:murein DD-endopeptidase MepM/ murein hydrolase activator NlpD
MHLFIAFHAIKRREELKGGYKMKRIALITAFFLLGIFIGSSFAIEVTLLEPMQCAKIGDEPTTYTESFPGLVGEGRLIIENGDEFGDHRVSSAEIYLNGVLVIGPKSFNQKVGHIESSVSLVEQNSITVIVDRKPGCFLTVQVFQEIEADNAAVVGTGGGYLSSFDDKVIIGFQEYSLSSDELIIIAENYNSEYHKVYDFSPDGITFLEPIQITFVYDHKTLPLGIDETELYLAMLNDNFEIVETLTDSTVDTSNHQISGKTTHFTNIGIASHLNNSEAVSPTASDLLKFTMPVRNNLTLTQDYNNLRNTTNGERHHAGIDLTGGEEIYATAFGKVVKYQSNGENDHGLGNTLVIQHTLTNGHVVYSLYAHLDSFTDQKMNWVRKGQLIGTMGGSGYGDSDYWSIHLHFEMKDSNILHNPIGGNACWYQMCDCYDSCWGYTPSDADKYGYHDPYNYFDKVFVQVAFLAKAEDSDDIFWIQNGKKYHVISTNIIEKMLSIPTWGWDKVATYPSDDINQFEVGRNFIEASPNSDGLLIKEIGTAPIYIVENGTLRHISGPDEFNQNGYDWNDIILVTNEIIKMLTEIDTDNDGILDDGDKSGEAGDNRCTGGNTVNCDDNCPSNPNQDQADSDGDGKGDVCDMKQINIDGDPSDWEGISPSNQDLVGDGLCNSNTDVKNVFTTKDDNWAYLMVETSGKPINAEARIDFLLDFNQDRISDLGATIIGTNLSAWNDPDHDAIPNPYPISDYVISWGEVLELKIPLSEIENPTYLDVIFILTFDFDYPIPEPGTHCDIIPIPPKDSDNDGILNDGDFSAIEGDNYCTGGETENCDDNCPYESNPDQADSDENGIGDACDQTPVALGSAQIYVGRGCWGPPDGCLIPTGMYIYYGYEEPPYFTGSGVYIFDDFYVPLSGITVDLYQGDDPQFSDVINAIYNGPPLGNWSFCIAEEYSSPPYFHLAGCGGTFGITVPEGSQIEFLRLTIPQIDINIEYPSPGEIYWIIEEIAEVTAFGYR